MNNGVAEPKEQRMNRRKNVANGNARGKRPETAEKIVSNGVA